MKLLTGVVGQLFTWASWFLYFLELMFIKINYIDLCWNWAKVQTKELSTKALDSAVLVSFEHSLICIWTSLLLDSAESNCNNFKWALGRYWFINTGYAKLWNPVTPNGRTLRKFGDHVKHQTDDLRYLKQYVWFLLSTRWLETLYFTAFMGTMNKS